MLRRFLFLLLTALTAAAQPANPPRLSYATYVGEGPSSAVYGFAVDSVGYVYVSGRNSDGCAFLTKVNQTGTAAIWSICLPMYQANSIALDASGHVYIAGNNQPFFSAAIQSSTILKLSPDAQQTLYSTSIADAYATKLALDHGGNAYLTGWAGAAFKATPAAYLTTGGQAFAAKLNSTGALQYATYLDFTQYQGSGDIAVDSLGQAWVVATTCPLGGLTASGCDVSRFGIASAVRKLDINGNHLIVTKSFGGGPTSNRDVSYRDSALGIAVDAADSVWIVGTAASPDVPTTPNALEAKRPIIGSSQGYGFGYAVKFSASGELLYGTYVGPTPGEQGNAIASVAVDSQQRPYFALNFPYQKSALCRGACSTVMGLSSDGSAVLLSTQLHSPVQSIKLDGKGGLYAAGNTSTLAFLTTPGVYQPLYPGGALSGYVAKFDLITKDSGPLFSLVVNAASLIPGYNPNSEDGAVAPGEIVTLFGSNFPPDPQVTFDRLPAPVLYSSTNQINAVVPFGVSTPSTVVLLEGGRGFTLPVIQAVPALFTSDATGYRQLAALNQDGSVNSSANPAKAGSVVSVYMTGAGALTPPIADGQIGPLHAPFPTPLLGVGATVNGVVTPVLFIGQAPGLIAGAIQANIQIPPATRPGDREIVIYVGNYHTQFGTTIAVQ